MFSPVLILSVVVIVVSTESIEDAAREEPETERIIFGKSATPEQFPYAVALFYNDQFVCTGSIISETSVLTAAHCVQFNGVPQPAYLYYAIANVNKSANNVRIEFESVLVHPGYNDQNIDNDVAIFTTTEFITFSKEVAPVCLARPNTDMNEYRKATVMGWGNISPIRIFVYSPDRLQYAEQLIVPNRKCALFNFAVNEDKICASGGLKGVCNGDSGGPMVALTKDKKPVQIGITSYINAIVGCGKIVPAVFTRVSSHYDFIMQNAEGDICTV